MGKCSDEFEESIEGGDQDGNSGRLIMIESCDGGFKIERMVAEEDEESVEDVDGPS